MEDFIKKIQENLSPDLLKGKWKVQNHPLEGHCYVAAEALWHMLDKTKWTPYVASYNDVSGKCTHWWLVNLETNEILDPTKEQYYPNSPPYNLGRRCGFLTKNPSKRAKKILDKIKSNEKTI